MFKGPFDFSINGRVLDKELVEIQVHDIRSFSSDRHKTVDDAPYGGGPGMILMLAVTVLVFTPLIAQGELFGTNVRGSVAPLNLAVICGAFMFGLGMQLGGGCASGTLFTAGGGNTRMMITLAAFIAGSLLGTWQWHLWQEVPGVPPIALTQSFGSLGGIIGSLILFATVWYATILYEKKKYGEVVAEPGSNFSVLRGAWPLVAGALALVLVQVATLVLAGRPWGVTSGFALWGAKIAGFTGLDVSLWPYWSRAGQAASLDQSVFNDITSVMNFGIMLGALVAAALARKFSPSAKMPNGHIMAAIIGGLMLGYGARIAFGCNIGR